MPCCHVQLKYKCSLHHALGLMTAADVEAGRSTLREKCGKVAADLWAKRGALLHKLPTRIEQALRLGARRARHIARSVVTIRAESVWGKFADSTVKKRRSEDDGPKRRLGRRQRAALARNMLGRVGESAGLLEEASAFEEVPSSTVGSQGNRCSGVPVVAPIRMIFRGNRSNFSQPVSADRRRSRRPLSWGG